jgi:hypothetical protein
MHLTEDGFVQLVSPCSQQPLIQGFGDQPWPGLWEDFVAEAKRFDGRKLMNLFGNTEPIHRPELDPERMTQRDRKVIGEFLRRHHHRLAHEIALFGVPGPTENRLELRTALNELKDLAGVVARSHGLSVRSSLDYLKKQYHNHRNPMDTHVVFLMALLRVADYLQVHPERAPKGLLTVRQLRSPVSQGEWRKHSVIREINTTQDDPEAIFVRAEPEDVATFLELKNLLNGIQSELDECWAVLGETYGRFREMNVVGLTLRRVHSNLDDVEQFAKTVDYYPLRAVLDIADAEILKLMIRPLYSNSPEIGIRELVQNAVDAVLELREYLRQNPDREGIELPEQEGDVVVAIEDSGDGTYCLTVSDRGIGMTGEIVRDYFLKAGASIRKSEAWRKQFEDGEGHSRVCRSGRFGVGVLAAFLLGDNIEVTSRHVNAGPNGGIRFTASVDADIIEIRRHTGRVGTTVRICISKYTRESLRRKVGGPFALDRDPEEPAWDWYCVSDPCVIRIARPKGRRFLQKHRLPNCKEDDLPLRWRRITHPDYTDIMWTYGETVRDEGQEVPRLVCNGIRVDGRAGSLWNYQAGELVLECPSLSVFDPDGRLPLNLLRDSLHGDLGFLELLRDDVIKDFLAYALVYAPSEQGLLCLGAAPMERFPHPGLRRSVTPLGEFLYRAWFYTHHGVSLCERWHIACQGFETALFVDHQCFQWCYRELMELYMQPIVSVINSVFSGNETTMALTVPRYPFFKSEITGVRLLTRLPMVNEADILDATHTEVEWKTKDLWLRKTESCPRGTFDFVEFLRKVPFHNKDLAIAEWYFRDRVAAEPTSPLSKAWQKIIGLPYIPYSLSERRNKLSSAYQTLAPYVTRHEALLREQCRADRDSKSVLAEK